MLPDSRSNTPPPDSRSKMISFRLSAEEYGKIREVCFKHGIQSVSEMARAGINLLLQQPERAQDELLEVRVREIERRVQFLCLEVKKLQPASACQVSAAGSE